MLSLRSFWSKHKRKVFVSLGVLGSGYFLFKLFDAHKKRILDLESEQQVDEFIKAQLQTHFENIQRISDTTTLPYVMNNLRSRISEELDLSHLTEKLIQGKGNSNVLTSKEKLELWERLKVLSFTRLASSLWCMTMICLYVRVQVNILGRHLYLEIASGLDEADSLTHHGQQDFLATADYFSAYGFGTLLINMQNAAMDILKEKQLKDPFRVNHLRKTINQILDLFMSSGEPDYWISYLVPENATTYRQQIDMSSCGFDDSTMIVDKLEQLMSETRAVLSSPEFKDIVEISLRRVVDVLVDEISTLFMWGIGSSSASSSLASGVPLAKILPRITQLGPPLLEKPNSNKYVQVIRSLPEVELFYTLLYANMPLEL